MIVWSLRAFPLSVYLTFTLCLPFPFFFHWYVHLRDLHSFPTRRSSDLFVGYAPADHPEIARVVYVPQGRGLDAALEAHSVLDRKSTRLNSSHRCISYAVFCLKKKRIQIQ